MNIEESNRSHKPSLALYHPPNARSKLPRASTLHHIQSPSSSTKKSNKSSIKRSKSLGSTYLSNGVSSLDDFNFSSDQIILIKKAVDNPNNLVMTQLMEIVTMICSKAMETSMNSYGLVKICFMISDKDSNQIFLESLINCCREWFNERDKLIKGTSIGHQPKQRFLAFIAFVTELYLNLKSKHRRVKMILSNNLSEENSEDQENELEVIVTEKNQKDVDDKKELDSSEDLFHLNERQSYSLAMLLYDCCHVILSSLSTSSSTAIDIECLLNILRSVGQLIEQENNQRMDKTMYLIRETYLGPLATKLSPMSLKSLLELIECRSSKWQLNQSQQIYYFPYTKPS